MPLLGLSLQIRHIEQVFEAFLFEYLAYTSS
jgi:hypothetical protein